MLVVALIELRGGLFEEGPGGVDGARTGRLSEGRGREEKGQTDSDDRGPLREGLSTKDPSLSARSARFGRGSRATRGWGWASLLMPFLRFFQGSEDHQKSRLGGDVVGVDSGGGGFKGGGSVDGTGGLRVGGALWTGGVRSGVVARGCTIGAVAVEVAGRDDVVGRGAVDAREEGESLARGRAVS